MSVNDVKPANHWIKVHGDLILDMIRIYLGLGLIAKGIYFLSHGAAFQNLIENTGNTWFAPALVGHYIMLAHLAGGFFLLIGLITRVAALVQIPILFAAISYVHMPRMVTSFESRQNLEFTMLVLFLLVLLSIYGAGRWSLDYWLARRENAALFHDPLPEPVPHHAT